ncbi:MAG: LacI family DNA-binding transcriptional regulator [Pseudomonadales bacterium]
MAKAKKASVKGKSTSYCVAEEAGVSQSAVSRAYKPGGSVSKATREKIFTAAKKLGYQPNAIARSLISKRSNMIGIVMADITNPFYPAVLEMFLERLQAEGLRGIVLMASRDQQVDDLLPQLLEYQIDGLVITSATLSTAMADRCSSMGVPVVLFNRSIPDSNSSSVCCDNQGAARQVADLFVKSEFTRIAYIAGVEETSTNREREEGFYRRLKNAGLSADRAVGNYTYEGGYQAALDLAEKGDYPEAIFCANDIMAMGAMDAIRSRLNLTVPDDVAIVGFDDIENASWPLYDLTTVQPPVERMVQRTVDNLVESQGAEGPQQVTETLAARIVFRGSAVAPG